MTSSHERLEQATCGPSRPPTRSNSRPEFSPEQLAEVRRLQGLYPDKRGALLPVLRLAQERSATSRSRSRSTWPGSSRCRPPTSTRS